MKIGNYISKKSVYAIISFLIISSLVFAILRSVFDENWLVLFVSVIVLVLSSIPIIIQKRTSLKIPLEIEVLTLVFIYASLFLGEVYSFYEKFPWWDTLLHASSAMVFGFIGFTILFMIYSRQEIKANPIVIAMFSLSFAIAIGATWEIFEYLMDQFFGLNMQRSGLADTMGDLMINTIGAAMASTIGFIFLKIKRNHIFNNSL